MKKPGKTRVKESQIWQNQMNMDLSTSLINGIGG